LQAYIYVDKPALSTGELVERICQLLDKTPPSWHILLSIATPIAKVSDVAAELTGIDSTGVNSLRSFPITAAHISDIQPVDEF